MREGKSLSGSWLGRERSWDSWDRRHLCRQALELTQFAEANHQWADVAASDPGNGASHVKCLEITVRLG